MSILQVLKRPEYFGKFGKIHKVVINNSTSYAGSQVSVTSSTEMVWHVNQNVYLEMNNVLIYSAGS